MKSQHASRTAGRLGLGLTLVVVLSLVLNPIASAAVLASLGAARTPAGEKVSVSTRPGGSGLPGAVDETATPIQTATPTLTLTITNTATAT